MRTATYVILALTGLMTLSECALVKQVEMTNPNYLTQMKVSEWALFNQNERYELYKDAELMVNNLNADIAKLATENEEQRDLLKAAQASLEEKKKDVKKEQLQIRMVVENQRQAKIMKERKILNMKNG